MEGLDVGELLARAGELDGLAHHGPDGQGRAAAGVAVELGEDYAVDAQLRIEGLGHVDRVLAGHGVHHEEDLLGLDGRLDAPELLHELGVDVQAARGVDNQYVAAVAARVLNGLQRRLDRVLRAVLIDRHVHLLTHHLQLLDGGRAVDVARGQQGLFARLLQVVGQLGGHGGLACALQAAEHIDGGHAGRPGQPRVFRAHQGGHFLVDDLDDLLGGRKAVQHLLAHTALRDPLAEVLDDQVVDVGLQKRHAHLAHALADGLLRQLAASRQLGERRGQLLTESLKGHGFSPPLPAGR